MAAKRERKLEYKDTFTFKLFPKPDYTIAQKLRFRLFQGRAEHWKKTVNYADAFQDPDRINLVYLIGWHKSVKSWLEDHTQSNLVVLSIPFTADDLAVYDRYWDMIKQMLSTGTVTKDGDILPVFHQEGRQNVALRDKDELAERFAQEYEARLKIISDYNDLAARSADYFARPTLIAKDFPEKQVTDGILDKLIKHFYPYGWEQTGVDGRVIRFPKRIDQAIHLGLERQDAAKLLGLPAGVDAYTACRKAIRRCEMDLNTALRKNGTVNLIQSFKKLQAPPYGWSEDAFSAWCFGYAVSDHLEHTWIWDGCDCFPARDTVYSVLHNIVRGTVPRHYISVLTEEDGKKLADRFAWMFGIVEPVEMDETDKRIMELYSSGLSERKIAAELGTMSNVAVHKRLVRLKRPADSGYALPFCCLAAKICLKIEGMTRWPVSILDGRLREALCGREHLDSDSLHCFHTPVLDRDTVREMLEHFTWERCRELKAKLEQINTIVPAMIRERYGDVDVSDIERYCTAPAYGWVGGAEVFWEGVERHVKHIGTHHRPDGWYYNDWKMLDK